jgi:predicted RNA binding protein YcfA (HicA-like mRNA interferase family)
MPKLRSLSFTKIFSILQKFGFEKNSQKGSHVKITRQIDGRKEILIIPNHRTLSKGTISAIYNQASKYISEEKLIKYFYTE